MKGFSLIELLVVICIIGILGAISVPAYNTYRTKVKLANIINTAQSYQAGIGRYYAVNGNYTSIPYTTYTSGTDYYIVWSGGSGGYNIGIQLSGQLSSDANGGSGGNGGRQIQIVPQVSPDGQTITWKCQAQFNYPPKCNVLPPTCQYQCQQ